MSNTSTIQCPNCGNEYKRVSQHWALGSCKYPDLTQHQKDVFRGLLMGDGCIGNRKADNPLFVIGMANESFLEWLSDHLDQMLYDPRLSMTAKESAEYSGDIVSLQEADPESCSDIYRAQSPRHPWFTELASWYDSGGKRFPDNIKLTPTIAKMWYIGDGSLRQREPNPNVQITSVNESDRGNWLCDLFRDVGFNPSYNGNNLVFGVADSKRFLEWLGDPVPGFEYKWNEINVGGKTPWREYDTLYEMYVERGMSLSDVGDELGCSADTVSKWLRHHQITVRTHGGEYV